MVTVTDYAVRQTKDGREFIALVLQGGLSLVQSKNTGNFYATVKKCSIPSTFAENIAKEMLGEKIAGSIQKKPCEPYEFTNKETGEVIQLEYRWVYVPEGSTLDDAIFEGKPEMELVEKRGPMKRVLLGV
jgi:hypothetical protein